MKSISGKQQLTGVKCALLWKACAVLLIFCTVSAIANKTTASNDVVIVNNQPYRVRMPMRIRGQKLGTGNWVTSKGRAVQQVGDDLVFIADLNASSSQRLSFGRGANSNNPPALVLLPTTEGVAVQYQGHDVGRLSWDVVVRESPPAARTTVAVTRPDFSRQFAAIPLSFSKTVSGPVLDIWSAEGTRGGLKLRIELQAYHDGFLDLNTEIENVSAAVTNVYAAAVCKWQQPRAVSRSVNYNNQILPLGNVAWSPFRGTDDSGTGEFRHMFIQRGVDWVNTRLTDTSALWLNDFAPSFTVHQKATDKRPGHWTGANGPQLEREVQTGAETLLAITEIARANTRYYLDRFVPNVLPPPGEPIAFSSRLVFADSVVTDARADEEFIGYVGYGEQRQSAAGLRVSIGVPGVSFGTNYFPYSTLGENFTLLKLPGMDRAAYWPLAADTVTKWRLFADDIRRDLAIAKAMGFEIIRLHHLELIAPLDEMTRNEYLDFLFAEIRRLKLHALIDAQMQPEEIAAIVRRYREVIHGVEIENEILIFGINDGREKYWNAVYAAVKKVDPNIPVHLTGHTNAGAFERLTRLGVKADRIGQHSYMDSVPAIPSARGYALAMANYARKVGKPSVITEWNWRGLTRLTPEARAKFYPAIFENVLKTRSVPEIYQFQFNESLAMDPLTLKGIRHYEPIWLSRRPKPEAFELMRLIREYSLPENSVRLLEVPYTHEDLNAAGQGTLDFRLTNTGLRSLRLRARLEAPANTQVQFKNRQRTITLEPGASVSMPVEVMIRPKSDQGPMAAKPQPGFYQVFLRLDGEDGLLRYGWGEARLAGAPEIDKAPNVVSNSKVKYGRAALEFDFNRSLAVVYGDKAPIQDVETSYALVNALESATGRPVAIYTLSDVPEDVLQRGALLLVGTSKTNKLIGEGTRGSEFSDAERYVAVMPANATRGERLIIGGATPEDAEAAAMDLLIRFWKYAKDSAARRIGLVAKEIPQGGDPALLP